MQKGATWVRGETLMSGCEFIAALLLQPQMKFSKKVTHMVKYVTTYFMNSEQVQYE